MSAVPDQTLAIQTLDGQRQPYGELVTRHQKSVFNVCFRILGERRDAEDLAQETFLRAYQKLNTFDTERDFGPWVRKIAANLCLNHIQKIKKTNADIPLDERIKTSGQQNDPEKQYLTKATEQHIREAILGLPPPHRVIIELRHYQDLSYKEISETLNLSLSDVKSYLFRARKALAANLSENNE